MIRGHDYMKTGTRIILAGAFLFIAGAFVLPVSIFLTLVLDDYQDVQFKVPGSSLATLDKPGRYYLWNDYKTVFQGKSYNQSMDIPDGMEISIRSQKNNKTFDFIANKSMSTSSMGSEKKSIGYIETSHAGTVFIEITGGDEERVFSFSRFGVLRIIGLIFGGLVLCFILTLAGTGLVIWGVVKYSQSDNTRDRQE